MALLALDLGAASGWAVERSDGRVEHGSWKMPKAEGQRFHQFRINLGDLKRRLDMDGDPLAQIVFEDVNFMPPKGGVYVLHCWGALWGNLLSWAHHHGIPCRGVAVATIKAHLTGKATAAKDLVTAEIKRRGYRFSTHDESDAIALLITVGDRFKPVHGEAA